MKLTYLGTAAAEGLPALFCNCEFCQKAREYELLLVPADSFGVEGYVRISYCVSKEMICASLSAFEALAKDLGLS